MSAKADVENSGRQDGLKWAAVLVVVAAGVYGNYYFSAEPLLYRALGLVVLGVIAMAVAFQTEKGSLFWGLLKDAKTEVRKVVWPTRQETWQTTAIVVLVVLVMGLVLWALDSLLGWIVSSLIG